MLKSVCTFRIMHMLRKRSTYIMVQLISYIAMSLNSKNVKDEKLQVTKSSNI